MNYVTETWMNDNASWTDARTVRFAEVFRNLLDAISAIARELNIHSVELDFDASLILAKT